MEFFFQSAATIEELKKMYKKLALKHHPDRGGDLETMKLVNRQYGEAMERLGESAKMDQAYRNIIDFLMAFESIEVELIGSWVWVTGETFPLKAQLKAHGFKWGSKKRAWYWYEGDYKKAHTRDYSLAEVRTMHESRVVKKAIKRETLVLQ